MACGRYSYQLLFFSLVAFLHGTTLAASTTSTAQVLPPRTSVKGYVDAGYQWIEEDSLNGGFRLQSAALYLEHRYQQTRFFFDLPIQWEGPLDTDNDGTADSAATNNFVLARERTQLYVEHGFTDWTVTLGQFDSIYGFESADSADIFFARLAWVGINVSHTTHNGLLVNRQFAPHWSLNFIVADAGGQGALGNTSPEYGIQIGWTQNNGYLKLGYIEYSDHGDPMRFSEALVGWSQPKWELHLELDHVDQVGQQEDTQAYLLSFAYHLTDSWSWGFRLDGAKDYPGTYRRQDQTFGLRHLVHDHLQIKADYRQAKWETVAGSPENKEKSFGLAAVYQF